MKVTLVAVVTALSTAGTNAYVTPTTSQTQCALRSTFTTQRTTPLVALRSESKDSTDASDDTLEKVEQFGRGAAKNKRGKRKGKAVDPSMAKTAASLTPEEVFFEGPPAITETIIPTISILTVVGIIPAAAAWARQAWVRYKITSRRVRVTSGVGGNEMSEIIYPDIVEMRTVKRLLGDGDLVAFLRDGAKFEMRNIPNFAETMEFILKQVDKDVAEAYRTRGEIK